VFAAELSWPKVKALAEAGAYALLPVGSTEAHGPHLPLAVDVMIADCVCRRLAQRLQALIFPPLTYGVTEFAARFAGTVSVSPAATQAYLVDVLCGIARHGFRRIGVINHHLEPAHFQLMHAAAKQAMERSGAAIAVPDHRKKPIGPQLGVEFTHGGSHAGNYETSLMLAVAPWMVDPLRTTLPELAVDLPAKIKAGAKSFDECGGPDAYLGNPAAATAEEGERLLSVLVEASEAALKALR
jgi:creatinine amidohydrolase